MAKLKRTMNCGCIIGVDYDDMIAVVYCPKHKAAPDMYEALELVDRAWVGDGIDMATAVDAVLLAKAKAEGGK